METTQNNECTKIRKKFEQSAAIRELNDIKNKMGGVDLDSICNDEFEITEKNLTDFNIKRLVQAVQCDLVYYDEQENCLVQKLTKTLKAGEITANEFRYKYKLSIAQLRDANMTNQFDLIIRIISQVTGRPIHLIGQLYGLDMEIAMACIDFFVK